MYHKEIKALRKMAEASWELVGALEAYEHIQEALEGANSAEVEYLKKQWRRQANVLREQLLCRIERYSACQLNLEE